MISCALSAVEYCTVPCDPNQVTSDFCLTSVAVAVMEKGRMPIINVAGGGDCGIEDSTNGIGWRCKQHGGIFTPLASGALWLLNHAMIVKL